MSFRTFLAERANVKHLASASDIGVVTADHFSLARETGRADGRHISNLGMKWNEIGIVEMMCYTIPDLTYLRHVDGDGRRARAENEEEEGDPSARNCETTNNHWRIERIECGRCNNWAVSYSVGRVLFFLFGRRAEKNKIYFFFSIQNCFLKRRKKSCAIFRNAHARRTKRVERKFNSE